MVTALEVLDKLIDDANNLFLNGDVDVRLPERYGIVASEPFEEGISVTLELDPGLNTNTVIHRDFRLFYQNSLQTAYGVPGHSHRQFLFKTVFQMFERIPAWFFDPNKLQLSLNTLEISNLKQIEMARRFHAHNVHDCPLDDRQDCRLLNLQDETDVAEYPSNYCTTGQLLSPTPHWKCSNHDLYLVIAEGCPDPRTPFEYAYSTYRYATSIANTAMHEKIDQLNQEFRTYLDYVYRLAGAVPTLQTFRTLKPLGLLLEIQDQLDQSPSFFDYLFESDAVKVKIDPQLDLFADPPTKKNCICSDQILFQKGCDCGFKEKN